MMRFSGTLRVAIITGAASLFLGLPRSTFGQVGGGAGGAIGGGAGGAIGGGIGGGITGGGGNLGGGGGMAGGGGRGAGGGAGFGSGASLGTSTGLGGTSRGGAGGSGPSQSNFLSSYFQYPYVQYPLPPISTNISNPNSVAGGSASSSATSLQSTVTHTVGAYGGSTFQATGGSATTTRGATRTGAGGRATTSRNLGAGSSTLTINGFSTMAMNSVNTTMPHYASTVRFAIPARPTGQLETELKALVVNSEFAPSAKNVVVQVDGRKVTLNGVVSNDDERRHIEALVRLTPGVSEIVNNLTVKQ